MATTSDTETFGDRLLQAVTDAGGPSKQDLLSKWFGERHQIRVSGAMLNKYKNKGLLPRLEKCREFALALDVTVEWLYSGRGSKLPGESISSTDRMVLDIWQKLDRLSKRQTLKHMMTLRPGFAEQELDRLIAVILPDDEVSIKKNCGLETEK